MKTLTLPWRNVRGRPLRSSLTVLGIAIAIAGFVAMAGLANGIRHAVEGGLDETGADLIVSPRSSFTLLGGLLPETLGPELAATGGVEVTGVLFNLVTADDRHNIPVAGWAEGSFLWDTVVLASGRRPAAGERGKVVLGETIARGLGKQVGDSIRLHFQVYEIVGIARYSNVLNRNLAMVYLRDLQEMIGGQRSVSFFQLRLKRPLDRESAARVRAALGSRGGEYSVQEVENIARDMRMLDLLTVLASAITVLAAVMAVLGVANTLFMAIAERTQEIGILRAIGWRSRRIVTMILAEAAILAFAGCLLGFALGVAAMHAISSGMLIAGLLEPHLSAGLVARALLMAVVVATLGAILPARQAIRLHPAEAMRRI